MLSIQGAGKSLELLELLMVGGERLRIGELAVRLDVRRSEALVLLVTLESQGMVHWDDQARVYRPGQKPLDLARRFLALSEVPKGGQASRRAKERVGRAPRSKPEERRATAGAR